VTLAETIQGKKWKATDLHGAAKILSPPPIGLGISFWPIHNYRCTGPATNAGVQQGHTPNFLVLRLVPDLWVWGQVGKPETNVCII
jgi:hypothetical protein